MWCGLAVHETGLEPIVTHACRSHHRIRCVPAPNPPAESVGPLISELKGLEAMKNFIHQFVELMRPRRRQFIYAALILMVFEVVKLAPPYLFKVVLDTLTSDATDKMRLVFLFAAGVLIAELVLACMHSLLVDRIILRILCWIEEYIPTKAQEKLLELSLGYHENEETGETIVQMERGTWKIADFVGNLLWHMFPLLIQTIATIIVMTAIDWQIASIFTLAIPVFVVM